MSDLNENMNNKRMSFRLFTGARLTAYARKSSDLEKTIWLAQYQDALGKLIDTLPIGIIIADSEHRIIAWNRTYIALFLLIRQ